MDELKQDNVEMHEPKDIYHLHIELPRAMHEELVALLPERGLLSIMVRRLLRIYIEQRKKGNMVTDDLQVI